MMIYPSIDDLLKHEPSKYSMIILASKRAHQLEKYDNKILEDYHSVKPIGKALEEVAAGELQIKSSDQ